MTKELTSQQMLWPSAGCWQCPFARRLPPYGFDSGWAEAPGCVLHRRCARWGGRWPSGRHFVAFRSAKGLPVRFFRGAKDDYRSPRLRFAPKVCARWRGVAGPFARRLLPCGAPCNHRFKFQTRAPRCACRRWAKSRNAKSQNRNNATTQNRIRGVEDRASESRVPEHPEAESQRNDSKTRKHYSNTTRNPSQVRRPSGVKSTRFAQRTSYGP